MKAVILTVSLVAAACGAQTSARDLGPATPGPISVQPAGVERAERANAVSDTTRRGYTQADVRFMQTMIGHHAQAIDMAALVETRTSQESMKLLAERIDVSQRDEIALMKRWLEARGESVPAEDAHQHAMSGHGQLMPGMLTRQEMDALAAATGVAFDRLFLESMIRHHEGAIEMVRQLLAAPGAGQEPELFMFVSDVNADQTAEIRRMQALLARLDAGR